MSFSESAFVRLRVTRFQAQLVAKVLTHIVNQFGFWESGNTAYLCVRPEILGNRLGFDRGEYCPEFVEVFRSLHVKLKSVDLKAKRLCMSRFELAAWAFCLRNLLKQISHGHVKQVKSRAVSEVRAWSLKLENLRKQAKRASNEDSLRSQSHKWQRFLRWIRVHFLSCSCDRMPLPVIGMRRRRFKQQLEFWTTYVAPLLEKNRVKAPPEQLREFVLRAMRSARRKFGKDFLVAHCAKEAATVHRHIYRFVLFRCSDAGFRSFLDERELLAARGQR